MGPTLLLILAVAVGTQAGPIDTISRDTTCARTCTGTNKFNYEQDKTYEFEYTAKTTTSMVGASEGHADLEVTGTAQIEVISKCELVLRVQNANLFETDPVTGSKRQAEQSREFQRALEANPLRFAFQDGEIEELCPAQGEQTWVLNIKRGILSMFQNTMDDFTRDQTVKESDVAGSCDAEYVPGESGWYTQSVKKTKNLLGCTERHGYNTAVQGTPYRVPSKIQSLPIVKSTHECQQDISKEGRLQGANCIESHVFRPFSRESSGAVTESKQKLKFLRERSGISTPPMVSNRAKLMFEHSYDGAKMQRTKMDLERKLMEICETTKADVRPETPKLFTDLVYLMRTLDADSMKQVYQQIKASQLCSDNNMHVRKYFLDAIPMVGTSASVRVLTELIRSNDVTGIEADMWMTSLAFIQNPTKDILKEALPLLSELKGMLSVGTLVHSYCRVASCSNDIDVRNIISELESKIGYGCYVDDTNMKRITIALRAIGNAGQAESATTTISSCMTRKENPTEVRLAAMDAFRRMTCDADRSSILAVFNDKEEDSELRIGAYIALMECPTSSLISRVKRTLETEEANQVGSFIWTHLTNLMETSSRHRQSIRAILEDEILQREFDMDKRKFSRNYEGSFFLEKLNTGASLEGNLIWSSKSFIPRSAMANLTIDLFGHSINLFEIGGRIEGLEYFLESYFGPNGYFSEEDVNEATEQSVKGISQSKFKTIDKRFKSSMDEMKGNLYLRVFGNELRYNSFSGVKDLITGNDFNFLDLLIKLSKNNDYSFTKNIMFLDSSMIIPTSTGFPLNLTVNGTATIDLKASGKMDLRKLGSSPRSVSINGIIQPSGSVLISSMMSVDAFVTKSGLKMVSTLHSSTAVQGHIELQNGRVFSAQIDMPREKMEILDMKTSFFTIHRDIEREQQMITENRQSKTACTGSRLAKITGLELCGEAHFPNASLKADSPYFPFTGPVAFAVSLYKRDTHTGYKMESKLLNTQDEATMRIAFDTPGSTTDRAMAVDFSLKKQDKTLEMNMISPWKKATFTGKAQYDRNVKHLSGNLDVDGKTLYSMKSEIKRSRKGASYVYTPNLEIRIPRRKVIKIGGSVEYQSGKLLDTSMNVAGLTKQPIKSTLTLTNKKLKAIKGSISFVKGKFYSFESRLQTYVTKKAIRYRPFFSVKTPTKELVALGGSVEYRAGASATVDLTLDKIVDKPVKIFGKIRKTGNNKRQRYQSKIDIRSPILTTKMQSNIVVRGMKALNVRTQMDYNIPRVLRDRVLFAGKINMAKTKTTTSLKGNTNIEFKRRPQYNLQIAGSMSHNKKHSEGNIAVTYGANKKDKSKRIVVSTSITPQLAWKSANLKVDTLIQHAATDIDVHVKLGHRHDRKSLDSSVLLELGKKKSVSSSLRLKNKSRKLTSVFGAFELEYPGREISISNDLSENKENDFTNELSAQFAQGEKSIVITNFRRPSPTEYEISSDINLFNREPLRLASLFNVDPKNLRAQVEKGNDRYSLTSTTQFTSDSDLVFNGEIQYPSRRITAEIEARKKHPVYTGRMDIKLNADRDDSQRVQLDARVSYQGKDNIDSSVILRYPTNEIALNLKHIGGKKYVSHVDLKWDSSKKMTLDTTFSHKEGADAMQIRGSIKVTTPFRGFRSIALDSTTQADSSKYLTSVNVNWKPMKKISATLTAKKPITWSNFDGSIVVKSPLKGYQKSALEISHAIGKKLASKAKLSWNKNFLQLNVEGANKGSSRSTDVSGRVSMKSTNKALKTIVLSFGHKASGKKFQNNLKLMKNGDAYAYEGEITHVLRGLRLQNNGRFVLTSPLHRYESSWSHKNTDANIVSNLNAVWGQKRIQFNLNGAHDLSWPRGTLSGNMELRTPFETIRNFGINLSHEHRKGLLNCAVNLNHDGKTLASFENTYNRENDIATSSHVFRAGEKEVSLKSATQYGAYPMTSKIGLQWSQDKKIELDGSFDKDPAGLVSGGLTFVSPFTSNKAISFRQNRNDGDTVTSASIQYTPTTAITMESRFQWDRLKKMHFTLNTPYASLRRLQSEIEFSGNLQNFRSAGSFEVQPSLRKVSLSSQWNSIRGISGNVRLDVPFSTLKYAQANIVSNLQGEGRKTSITLEYSPRKTILIETTGKLQPYDIEGTIKITTPFSAMPYTAAVMRHTGGIHNFQTNGDIECPSSGKYEIDVNFQNNINKQGSITVKIPARDDVTAGFSHSGDMQNFQSHAEFGYKAGSKYEADVKYDNTAKTEGSVVLKSPVSDDIIGTFSHSGDLRNFQTHGEFEYVSGKKYELDINLNTNKRIDGSATLKVPDLDNMNIAFNHRGRLANFRSHAEFTYKKGETFEGDFLFNAVKNINTKLSINTPIKGYRKLKASFVHKGSWKSFTCNANMANGKRNIQGNVKFILNPTINAQASIQTPFKGYKSFKVSATHEGSMRSFRSHAELSAGKSKQIIGDVEFSLDPSIKISSSLLTPFKGLENTRMALTHDSTQNSFASHAELSYRRNNPVVANIKYDSSSGITAEASLQTPFKGYERLTGIINHSGSLKNFATTAEFANGSNKKISGDARFNMMGPITGEATLMTPFEGLELNRLAFSHDGTSNNFRCHGEIVYNRKKTESDITFSALDDIEGNVIVKSPYFQQFKATFSSQGPLSDHRSKATIVYGRENMLDSIVSFATNPAVRGSLSLQSIFVPRTQVTFSHEGEAMNFHTQGDIAFGNRRMELDATFNAVNDISGNLVLKTPFFGDVQAAISHTGRRSAFRSHLEGAINEKKIETDVTFSSRSGLSGTVNLKTPFTQYSEMEASFSHSGQLKNFQSHAEYIFNGQKTELDTSFSSTGPITGRASLKTPVYRDIIVQFNHDGSLKDFTSHGEITYSGKRQMTGDLSFHTNPSVDCAATIKTPFEMFRLLQATVKHEGSIRNFKTEAEYTLNTEKTSVDIYFDSENDLVAKASLSMPNTNEITISLTHSGVVLDFHSHAELFYSGQKQYEYDAIINAADYKSIEGNINMKTPILGFESMTVILTNKDDMQRMTTLYSMEGFTSKKIEIEMTFEKGQKKDFALSISSPFSRDIRIASSFSGNLPDIQSSVDVLFDNQEKFHGAMNLVTGTRISGSLLIRVAEHNINSLFNHQGNMRNFKSHAEMSLNGEKIESDITYKNTDRTAVSIQLLTPFTNFENTQGLISYTPTRKGKDMHAEILFNRRRYEGDFVLNTVGPLETSLALRTPFEGLENTKAALTNQIEDGQMQLHAEIMYGNQQKIETDISLQYNDNLEGSFSLRTPFRDFQDITTSFRHQKSASGFLSHAEIIYNSQKNFELDVTYNQNVDGSIVLKTPISRFEHTSISLRRDGYSHQLNVNYDQGKRIEMEVYWRNDLQVEGRLNLKTPFSGFENTIISFRGQKTAGNIESHAEIIYAQNKLEADVVLSNVPLVGSITVKTPYSGYEETFLSFQHDMSSSQLRSHAELIYGQQQKIEADINLSNSPITGRFSLKTPFSNFENTAFSVENDRSSDMFKVHTEFIYGQQEKIEGDLELTKIPLKGTFSLKTPFRGMEETIVSVQHETSPNSFRNHAEFVYGSEKLESDISFSNRRQMEGQVTLKTPFSGFEEISALFQHSLTSQNLRSHAEVNYSPTQKIEADLSLSSQDHMEGSFVLKTPFSGYRDITALVRHTPATGSIQSHAEISLESQKSEFDIELENRLDTCGVTASLRSPWYETIGILFSKNGPLDNLVVKAETSVGDRKTVEIMMKNVKIGSKIESSFSFQNPYTEDILATFDHNGGWRRFTTNTELSIGSQNRLRSETTFRRRTGIINVGSTLIAVIDGASRTAELNLKHNGDINNFKSGISATYEGRKIDLKTQFKNAASIEGSFILKTPFPSMRNIGASFQHSGSINQFSSSGNIQYAPGKQLEGKVEFFKYGWRRISSSVELKTPFDEYRFTKVTYKHRGDADSIQCNGDLTYGSGKQLIGSLKASTSPLEITLAARTPFRGYEDISTGAKFEEQSQRYTTEAFIVYATGKSIEAKSVVDLQANPMSANARLTTPFTGFESTDITLTHSGTSRNFKSTGEFRASYLPTFSSEASMRYDSISEFDGLVTFSSEFENFENLKLNLRNTKSGDEYHSHLESSWSPSDVVVADTHFSLSEVWNGKNIVYGLSISTPFEPVRSANIKGAMELTDKYADQISIEHNGETILDMDMEYTKNNKHSTVVNIREPRSMVFSSNGLYTDSQKGADITINWNTKDSDSNIKLEGLLNDNSDYYTNKKDITLKVSRSRKSIGLTGVMEKSSYRTLTSADFAINEVRKVGYEMETTSSSRDEEKRTSLKLRLPSRTLAFSGSYGSNSAEGAILWDADRDETKKIAVRGNLVPQPDSVKADVSFSMPSIGKDVHLDSEMTLSNGRVIFDGKTEFRYSDDSRKTLVIHSKLQDTSVGYSKNYSMSFGISHPYTSVDIQMKSHVGQSDEKYTAGMDVLYLTAQRQRKNFALMGEIDNFRNEMNLQIVSPAKSIRLQGNVKSQAPYQISVRNLYDNKPIDARATFNPVRKSVDISFNYDIDNPRKVYHISSRYVNSSAIIAEMYREENSQRVTDSLLAIRLNTSRILHTRLHWRPSMLRELKEYGLDKIHRYGTKIDSALSEAGEAISEELNYKYNLIRQAASEDLQPFADFVTESMAQLGTQIREARQELDRMYRSNEYYTQDIYVYYDTILRDIQNRYSEKMEQVRQWSENMKSAASSWTYFPLKDTYDHYLLTLREILQEGEQTSSLLYRQLLETVETKLIELSKCLEESYSQYRSKVNGIVTNVTSHPSIQLVQDKYSQYLNKLRSFKIPEQAQNIAAQYSGAIYNARETINTGLASLMNRKDIKYVHGMANEAYHQGAAAYKYWEVEENVKSMLKQIYEYIREEIEEEISSVKDSILNLKKSSVTVYDPENGEIQSDLYLPVSLTSLDTLPNLNVVRYVNRVKSYIPDTSKWSSVDEYIPDTDVYNMIPPFKGMASVNGDHVTTFDGEEFDISGRCSYILARDYVNGNFTIITDYLGQQKRKLVVMTATQNIQVSPTSKVKVNGRLTKVPYKSSEVEITQDGEIIKINGRGFSIADNVPRDLYEISVSGWYFGKTGGLLGTLNNERYDDMMTSSKRITDDANAFIDSWEVDSNCR